jgi:hypothetical protein
MLAAQMAAVDMATMSFTHRLAHTETLEQQDSAERALTKLAGARSDVAGENHAARSLVAPCLANRSRVLKGEVRIPPTGWVAGHDNIGPDPVASENFWPSRNSLMSRLPSPVQIMKQVEYGRLKRPRHGNRG